VFQEHALPSGTWDVNVAGITMRVNPADIKDTALFTIEGELDDISGSGQTQAAQGLCRSIDIKNKQHFIAPHCGHYGIFSGKRWREVISPKIISFIALNETSLVGKSNVKTTHENIATTQKINNSNIINMTYDLI
jgi:poly(3-hydroxybutyrate) depolymerase